MNELDAIIAAMYQSVCYEAGDLPSYRDHFEQMIASGELPSFWEGELWRETRLFGDMAHVLSAYETRRTREGALLNRGVNSIQLFQRDGRWWISAMIWRREGRDVRIPLEPNR